MKNKEVYILTFINVQYTNMNFCTEVYDSYDEAKNALEHYVLNDIVNHNYEWDKEESYEEKYIPKYYVKLNNTLCDKEFRFYSISKKNILNSFNEYYNHYFI